MRYPLTAVGQAVALAVTRRRPGSPLPGALRLTGCGALWLASLAPAFGMPVSVALSQGDAGALQMSVGGSGRAEPELHWGGSAGAAPYRLALAWKGEPLTLERPLPSLPAEGMGPLKVIALRQSAGETRLELQLGESVQPYLRRVGTAWVLRLDPVEQPPETAVAARLPPVAAPVRPSIPAPAPGPADVRSLPPVAAALPGVAAQPAAKTVAARAPFVAAAPATPVAVPPAVAATPAPNTAPALPSSPAAPTPTAPPPPTAPLRSPTPEPSVATAALSPIPPPSARGTRRRNGGRAGPEVLLLDVIVNGQRQKEVVRTEQAEGGPLLLPVGAWQEARLAPLPQPATLSDGSPAFALDAVAGASYRINRQALTLEINAPATAFVGSTLGPAGNVALPPPRPEPGVMLNYDLSAAHTTGSTSAGALVEAVAFGGLGNFVNSARISHDAGGSEVSRLDSYWRYDLPHRMETVVVGDTVGVGGGWSRPVRYGGVRWGRDFGMRPGFVTLPQIALAGEAALPSTVEVLVNNARRLSQPVAPGPFDLNNVPVVTGAGEIGLVVRDLLGRETVVTQSYYASPRLLAPGLSDFSFEAGWLRSGYSQDTDYRDPFGAATWRQGLRNSLTGEGRVEVQRERRAAGVELSGLLGSWAVWRAAAAGASSSLQDVRERGGTVQVGLERSTPRSGGGTVQYEHSSRGFAPFGEGEGLQAREQRARDRWLVGAGGPLWGAASGGASYVRQSRWDGEVVQLLGLSMSMPLWQRASLSVSVNKRLGADGGWSASLSASLPLENGIHTAARAERGTDGRMAGTLSAAQSAPAGPGLGWRVQATTTESQRVQGGVQYNTNNAEFALDAVAGAKGEVSTRGGARGSVGWVDGTLFASRPVGHGSVAVVKVEGLPGVPVMRANQVVATTDASGRAFVPGLLPWQKNLIAIDPVDLPLDVQVGSTSQDVVPYARTGMVVDFKIRRSRQALLVLQQSGGTPVPAGTKVRLLPAGPEFVAGRRGEVWLTDLQAARQQVRVSWAAGACTLDFDVPAAPDGTPGRIGPLVCSQ